MRNGPHCISTCAITRSLITDVTSPTMRLRAEDWIASGSGAECACWRATLATTAPSMVLRFEPSS